MCQKMEKTIFFIGLLITTILFIQLYEFKNTKHFFAQTPTGLNLQLV